MSILKLKKEDLDLYALGIPEEIGGGRLEEIIYVTGEDVLENSGSLYEKSPVVVKGVLTPKAAIVAKYRGSRYHNNGYHPLHLSVSRAGNNWDETLPKKFNVPGKILGSNADAHLFGEPTGQALDTLGNVIILWPQYK